MRRIVPCLLCLYVFAGCKKNSCRPESFRYDYLTGKSLDTASFVAGGSGQAYNTVIKSGNGIVFRYVRYFSYCNNQSDAAYETVQFELPGNSETFQFLDSAALRSAKVIYSYWATGAEAAYFIKQGSLRGTKLANGEWQIEGPLLTPTTGNAVRFGNTFKVN